MAITLKDVAEAAGVSRSAVSRTFTDGASVSAKTRAKVETAARKLGYQPSLIARSLATKRSKLVGLVANNFQNAAFLDVFDLFTSELQALEYRPLLVNLSHETDPARSLTMLKQYSVDGVIVATSTLPPAFASSFREAGIPVVHTFGKHHTSEKINTVGIDNIECGKLAARALHERGYRRVGMIGGPEGATSTKDRVRGFHKQAKAMGLEIVHSLHATNYTYEAGRDAMSLMMKKAEAEAIFCGDDLICMGAMDLARAKGLAIPGDIGFLGVNGIAMSGWSAYNLTTIRQPIRDIILSSVELIVSLMIHPEREAESRIFSCAVVERGTLRSRHSGESRDPPVSNPS